MASVKETKNQGSAAREWAWQHNEQEEEATNHRTEKKKRWAHWQILVYPWYDLHAWYVQRGNHVHNLWRPGSHWNLFWNKGFLTVAVKIIEKYLWGSSIFNKVADWEPLTLLKMNIVMVLLKDFDCEFHLTTLLSEHLFLRTPFFPGHVEWLLLECKKLFERFLLKIFLFSKYLFVNFSLSLNIKL